MTAPTLDPATESTLWAAIAAAPDDDAFKLIAADWYADNGDAAMEAGLRYCVREGKWPYISSFEKELCSWFDHTWLEEGEALTADELPKEFGEFESNWVSLPAAVRWLGERVTQGEGG